MSTRVLRGNSVGNAAEVCRVEARIGRGNKAGMWYLCGGSRYRVSMQVWAAYVAGMSEKRSVNKKSLKLLITKDCTVNP